MAPGGTLFRFPPHFGENVLPHGSHEWLPYSKDEVRLKSVNNNLSAKLFQVVILIIDGFQLPVNVKPRASQKIFREAGFCFRPYCFFPGRKL